MNKQAIRGGLVWLAALATCTCIGRAEDPASILPDHPRDEAVQSPQEYFGFPIGSRHLRHAQVADYLGYLAEASERASLIAYGRTHGGRPLQVLVITSPENSKNLEEIRRRRRRLTSGRLPDDLSREDLSDEKLVMYLGYSVHGDEASAVNAAPLVAYHLASSDGQQVQEWLRSGVYLLDPAINPDGIDRFANWVNENRGQFASPRSIDREHRQPWPGGRTNYYWFDLNRDWLPLAHPESQGRLELFHAWKPNVVLDFHEMSGNSSFFFQPGIPARNNPFSPPRNLELTRRFADEHVRSMDAAGELYYTEERFDDFYVGKGSTYPDLHGAVGILFEQGSTRGLRLKNERTDRTFGDTVANQVRTSLSSLRAAANLREELLDFQTSFYRDALEAGRQDGTTAYVLLGTTSRLNAAGQLLHAHAIKAYRPQSSIKLAGETWDRQQVLIVPTAQAEYTFIKSLMEPLQEFPENIFYDVSSWHFPSAFDLRMHRLQSDLPPTWLDTIWRAGRSDKETGPRSLEVDVTGYAFPPVELGVPRLVAALHRSQAHLRVSTEPFVTEVGQQPVSFPQGTFLLLRQPNAENWNRLVRELGRAARANAIEVTPLKSGFTLEGPDLGSDTALEIPVCNPLLIVGDGTRAYSAGALWHYLDVRLGQPCTLVDAEQLSSTQLNPFTCVILPEGSYSNVSGEGIRRLKQYVQQGGTVIGVASAIRWLERQELIHFEEESESSHGEEQMGQSQPSQLAFGDARDARALESIAGAFLATQVDPTHPLAYGFPDPDVPVFRDHTYRWSLPENTYQVAATYTEVIAGYVSHRNRQRLRHSAAAWVESSGSGRYILLADNPVFRGYVRSSERFLSNAMLLGPSIRIPPAAIAQMDQADTSTEQ